MVDRTAVPKLPGAALSTTEKLEFDEGRDLVLAKVCTKCRKRKAKQAFYANVASPDGVRGACITCHKTRVSTGSYPTRKSKPVPAGKLRCPRCKQVKAYKSFHHNKSTKNGYSTYCIKCNRFFNSYQEKVESKYNKLFRKDRPLEVTLTFDEYKVIIEDAVCFYCRGPLSKTGHDLDRKDNSKGYFLDNVVPCCIACNKLKGANLTFEEMCLVSDYRKGVVVYNASH